MFGLLAVLWLAISLTFTGMFLAAGALLALVVGIRLAWLRRRSRHARPVARSRVVDGQYVVLERRRDYVEDGVDD
jgi:hypothetical protein